MTPPPSGEEPLEPRASAPELPRLFQTFFPSRAAQLQQERHQLKQQLSACTEALDRTHAELEAETCERRKIEEAVRQREKRFRALVQYASDVITLVDRSGVILYETPSVQTLAGHHPEDFIGRPLLDRVLPEDAERLQAAFQDCLSNASQPVTVQVRLRHAEGHEVPVEIKASNLLHDPAVGAVVVNTRDVTDRLLYEQALRLLKEQAGEMVRLKSTFLSSMSHEIRTPMNGIVGMVELLQGTELTAAQSEYLEIIRASADNLLEIVHNILDLSQIEAGLITLDEQPFEVRGLVEEVLDVVTPQAAAKRLELAYLVDPNVPHTVGGDRARVRQILVNLLSNAVKFTPEGEVFVAVNAHLLQNDCYQLHFTVRDTGIGIPADYLGQLFQPFSQADPSTTRRYGGTGLGLAISKSLCDLMGGMIWAESEVGRGTTFHVTLQVHALAGEGRIAMQDPQPALDGRRALIVADNEMSRRILTLYLKAWGMMPRSTETARQALEWIRSGMPFDVIMYGLPLSCPDGLALARMLQDLPESRRLPLILLRSVNDTAEVAGVQPFATLTRPVKQGQLLDTLTRLFAPTAPARGAASGANTRTPGAATFRRHRILLAEDNPVNQKVAQRLLDRLGYRADIASNGREALEAVQRTRYDILLLDIQMPVMDGLETARRIVAEVAPERRPHMIALTANAMQGDRERCLDAGMDDYVSKPVRLEDLAAAFGRYERLHPTAPGPELLDRHILDNLRRALGDDDPAFMEELLSDYVRNAAELVATARAAAAAADAVALRMAVHTLKSSSATFGATSLARLCKELEDTCERFLSAKPVEPFPAEQARACAAAIDETFRQVRAEIEGILPALAPR